MIGYLIEQELENVLPASRRVATLLTQVEVDPRDPAFRNPPKPVGPVYGKAEAEKLAKARGSTLAPDGDRYSSVVPSPLPQRIPATDVIRLLAVQNVIGISAGGGGIPVAPRPQGGPHC